MVILLQKAEIELSLHTARMPLQNTTIDELLAMKTEALSAAELLAHADVDIICYGCTSGSLIHGPEFARSISKMIHEKTGIPTVTTSEAVLSACKQLEIKSIVVITPYTDDINQKEVAFLENMGINVLAIRGLGLINNLDIGRFKPTNLIPIVHENTSSIHSGGIFISCTNLRTIGIIQLLEDQLGIPVFSSNTASFFGILNTLKIPYHAKDYGQLLLRI